MLGINDEKVDFTDDYLVCERVLSRDRVLLVVPALEHLLPWNLEDFKKNFDEIGAVKVVEVLLAEVSLVSRLYTCNYARLIRFYRLFNQTAERTV